MDSRRAPTVPVAARRQLHGLGMCLLCARRACLLIVRSRLCYARLSSPRYSSCLETHPPKQDAWGDTSRSFVQDQDATPRHTRRSPLGAGSLAAVDSGEAHSLALQHYRFLLENSASSCSTSVYSVASTSGCEHFSRADSSAYTGESAASSTSRERERQSLIDYIFTEWAECEQSETGSLRSDRSAATSREATKDASSSAQDSNSGPSNPESLEDLLSRYTEGPTAAAPINVAAAGGANDRSLLPCK